MREFFLKTDRIGFSKWDYKDQELAKLLWGDPEVTKYICASGVFSQKDIINRLNLEISNLEKYQVQYWPIFELETNELIGCCGLRPRSSNGYEIGFHLRKKYWNQGYATESAKAVINFAFNTLNAKCLFAGHNPNNKRSKKVIQKLGFAYLCDEFYEPTGLYHPLYKLTNPTPL